MSRSLVATEQGVQMVEEALTDIRYSKQKLANEIGVTIQTVRKFFKCLPIDRHIFSAICTKSGLDWRDVSSLATVEPKQRPVSLPSSNAQVEYDRMLRSASQRVWIYQTWLPTGALGSEHICRNNVSNTRLLLLSFQRGSPIYRRIQGRHITPAQAKSNSIDSIEAFIRNKRLDCVRFNYGHHPGWIAVLDSSVFWGPTPVDTDSHAEDFLFHKHDVDSEEGEFWVRQFETMWDTYSHSLEKEKAHNTGLKGL